MNKQVKIAWLKALRSGKYKQGRGWLKVGDAYCCLGVVSDLAVKAGVIDSFDGSACGLCSEVIEWAGLDDELPAVTYHGWIRELSALNDGQAAGSIKPQSFKQIARYIERDL